MILAAGRGERMRPLTDHCPKPLLKVGDKSLIERLLLAMADAGITDIVINHAWLGNQIEARLASGSQLGVRIAYSPESPALETAGGIARALPLLGTEPFAVVNGDICTDFDFQALDDLASQVLAKELFGGCLLVDNPSHNSDGDFAITQGLLRNTGSPMFTFSGIAVYQPAFFSAVKPDQPVPLRDLLREAADHGKLAATAWHGQWTDVGTPARLQQLNDNFKNQQSCR